MAYKQVQQPGRSHAVSNMQQTNDHIVKSVVRIQATLLPVIP